MNFKFSIGQRVYLSVFGTTVNGIVAGQHYDPHVGYTYAVTDTWPLPVTVTVEYHEEFLRSMEDPNELLKEIL